MSHALEDISKLNFKCINDNDLFRIDFNINTIPWGKTKQDTGKFFFLNGAFLNPSVKSVSQVPIIVSWQILEKEYLICYATPSTLHLDYVQSGVISVDSPSCHFIIPLRGLDTVFWLLSNRK